jgi:hypothetical protein
MGDWIFLPVYDNTKDSVELLIVVVDPEKNWTKSWEKSIRQFNIRLYSFLKNSQGI